MACVCLRSLVRPLVRSVIAGHVSVSFVESLCYGLRMGNPVPDSKTPVLVAFVMVVTGIALAAVHGLVHGSIPGGVIAAGGAIPACYGMWKGIQQETQGTLAMSVAAVLVCLAVGAVLIVLRVVSWLH